VAHFTEFAVELYYWLGLFVKLAQSVLEGFLIVIITLNGRGRSSGKAPVEKGLFAHIVEQHVLALAHILLEVDCLVNSAGETIDEVILAWSLNESVN